MTWSTLKQTGILLVFCEGTDLCIIDFKDIYFRDSAAVFTNRMNKWSSIYFIMQHEYVTVSK
jgi:hypothetical protein